MYLIRACMVYCMCVYMLWLCMWVHNSSSTVSKWKSPDSSSGSYILHHCCAMQVPFSEHTWEHTVQCVLKWVRALNRYCWKCVWEYIPPSLLSLYLHAFEVYYIYTTLHTCIKYCADYNYRPYIVGYIVFLEKRNIPGHCFIWFSCRLVWVTAS